MHVPVSSMAVQMKQSVVPEAQGPLSTQAIQSQRKGNRNDRMRDNSQTKRLVCSEHSSAQINPALPRITAVINGPNIDEKLRAARERREEQLKLLAHRENKRLEREQRARQYYERQLKERKKKLVEHRLKEEKRRAAVEEKRRQRLKEEKERFESAVRKTLEKSQKAQQSQNPRGRKLSKNTPRRLPLTTWEKNLVTRLLTPTFSYLARSKSAGCHSGAEVVPVCRRAASFHSTTNTTILQKPPYSTGSAHERPPAASSPISIQHRKPSSFSSPINSHRKPSSSSSPICSQPKIPPASRSPINSQHRKATVSSSPGRSTTPAEIKPAKKDSNKKNVNVGSRTPSPSARRRVQLVPKSRKASPSPDHSPPKSIGSRSTPPLQLELPPVPEEDICVSSSALSPGSSRHVQAPAGQQGEAWKEKLSDMATREPAAITRAASRGLLEGSASPSASQLHAQSKPGTNDPDEAARLLAERRREARLKREREEQERLRREEEERQRQDELERRRTEEQARQQAEAQRLIEEKRRREEEEQRRAEEERAQAMREAALLQKQREEEQARERARAEQLRKERELLAQKEDAARQARKKRLEEIMRRTRRTDSADMSSESVKASPNEATPKENTQPVHSGTIEDAAKLPVGTKTSQLVLTNEEDMVPVVAFKERRSLRTLTGLEEIQTHQRAEVI